MFRASLCPSSGEQRPCYCIWCVVLVLLDVVGSGCGALSCRMWSLWRFLFNIWLLHFVGFLCLHTLLTMHGHRNLKLAKDCQHLGSLNFLPCQNVLYSLDRHHLHKCTGCPKKSARFKVRAIVVLLGWRHWKFNSSHLSFLRLVIMERYAKEQRVLIVKRLLQNLLQNQILSSYWETPYFNLWRPLWQHRHNIANVLRYIDFGVVTVCVIWGHGKYAPAAFTPPGNISCAQFYWRLSRTQGQSTVVRTMSMKNSNNTVRNRTRDFPACHAVPQPTAPPMCRERSPKKLYWLKILMKKRSRYIEL